MTLIVREEFQVCVCDASERKYELVPESRKDLVSEYDGSITHIYQIRALRDFADVKAGDLGGWINSEYNLSHSNDCWVYPNGTVFASARVETSAQLRSGTLLEGCLLKNSVVLDFDRMFRWCLFTGEGRVESLPRSIHSSDVAIGWHVHNGVGMDTYDFDHAFADLAARRAKKEVSRSSWSGRVWRALGAT